MIDRNLEIPDWTRTIDGIAMAAYAGATWDWTQTHLDTSAARSAGFELPVVDGQMLGALLVAHAQDAIGPRSRATQLRFRHSHPVFRGDRIRIRGRILRLSEEGLAVTLHEDIDVVDVEGAVVRQAVIGAEVTVSVAG